MQLTDIKDRLILLRDEIDAWPTDAWLRSDTYQLWVDKLNALIEAGNNKLMRDIAKYAIQEKDYSKSHKTIIDYGKNRIKKHIENYITIICDAKRKEDDDEKRLKCFLVNHKCPHNIQQNRHKFFIGMPFNEKNDDAYRFGILPTLDTHGLTHFRADEIFECRELVCKICQAIQESTYIIIDLSDNNPNVMFELGLACGLCKPIILLKDIETKVITDLHGIEYIEYKNASDLQSKLRTRLEQWNIC